MSLQKFIDYLLDLDRYENGDSRRLDRDFIEIFVPMIYGPNWTYTLNDLAKLLNVRETHLKDKFPIIGAVENRDYKVIKSKTGTNGRPKNNIYLTSDLIKRVAASSHTEKGRQFLTHLIMTDEAHKEYMMEAMEDRKFDDDDVLDMRVRPNKNQWKLGHCVYCIKCVYRNSNDEL